MTRIQEVLLGVETDYRGHPYYVTGHALYTAIARRADAETRRRLHASHGMLLPGEYGTHPDRHPASGGLGKLSTGLRDVETYADLLVYRDPASRWLREDGPRDAHNTLAVRTHGGRLAVAPTRYFGRPPRYRNHKRSVNWVVQAFLHAEGDTDDNDLLPLDSAVLDGLRLGGARNYGLGETSLVDSQVIELDDLDYSWLRDADAHRLELLTPYVLWSEYPGADEQSIPRWWGLDGGRHDVPTTGPSGSLRRRRAQLCEDGETYRLGAVDHGQVVGYAGDRPVETARNGVARIGTHSRYGFGELRVVPAGTDRVPGRASIGWTISPGTNTGSDPGGV